MVISYSFVNDYTNCPRKAYHKYVIRDMPKEDSTALRHGNVVHRMLEDAINDQKPIPSEYPYERFIRALQGLHAPLKAEVKVAATSDGVACDYYAKEVAFRGKVDVLISTANEAVLVDWKTGKIREDPLELEIQASLVGINLPSVGKLSGYYVWLAEGKVGRKHSFDSPKKTFDRLTKIREEAMNRTEWEPKPNPLCGWCALKTCEFNRRSK